MNIVVCVKQIIDPEIPPRQFRIDPDTKEAVQGGASLVIGPFDLNALEVAIQLKEAHGGKVTAVTLGSEQAKDALKRALAMGADEAVLVHDPLLERPDSFVTARALAAAIKKLDACDLVLCGRQGGDWDLGQVGPLLAEELGVPCIPFAPKVEAANGSLRVQREQADGYAVVESPLPALVTVTNAENNAPRLPKVRDIMMANRKPVTTWQAADLGLDAAGVGPDACRVEVVELLIPEVESECELVDGESGAERGANLARRLAELKKI